ncbi:C4-dicarboxylate-specific signal transduction histidine kinase [Paenibacillus phyllosphaerae]|uniref:C4-dicarboxylate-specific signal transduction histidine kinase n=1 Tax=Paenibacillus phyllosphaerae TaxID=274593 RepID=A0A7W5AZ65_9BACL|nr:cache domain-containing protein [Paenibacillus phyllosphaerae]MBB3110941.1 C4-dicarboxylate-specific signal transduction histidine kinase [Paenibacillus phyllosphaerae]
MKATMLQRMQHMSLRKKLPLMISALVITILVGSNVFVYLMGSSMIMEESKQAMNDNADRLSEGLWTAVQMAEQAAYLTSDHSTFRDLLHLRAAGTMSDEEFLSSKNPLYTKANQTLASSFQGTRGNDSFVLMDTNGTIIASTNPNVIGQSRADRDYFAASMTGQSFISDALVAKDSKKLIFAFSHPVKDASGKILGVFATAVTSDYFTNKFKDIKVNDEGMITILSRTGVVLYTASIPTRSAL